MGGREAVEPQQVLLGLGQQPCDLRAGTPRRSITPGQRSMDPVAILTQLLVAFGAAVGRGAHFQVEATLHHPYPIRRSV